MGVYYLGAFPIEGGGVTLKNQYLFDAFRNRGLPIKKIDFNSIKRKRNVFLLIKLIFVLLNPFNRFCIGISTGKNSRRKFTHLLYWINRPAMRNSIIMIMGGTAADEMSRDIAYCKWTSFYKKVYVETNQMFQILQSVGLKNCAVYPNCRYTPKIESTIVENQEELKCVFFSYIVPQKGVELIINAAKQLPNITFSFYGHIDSAYEKDFFRLIDGLSNLSYKGNFRGTCEDIYRELNGYDVLLFPTKFKTEGVPGILVEAKIAGIATIVSNESHNAELVSNGVEGIVMEENNVETLVQCIQTLNNDRDLLLRLKKGSLKSAQRFFIETYIDSIIKNFYPCI